MSEAAGRKSQEEYEDDFEKDLDWLISEEGRGDDQGPDYKDIEAEIDKELEEDEKQSGMKEKKKKEEKRGKGTAEGEEDQERWPSPMEPLEYDSDRDSPSKSTDTVPPPPTSDEQTDEEKKYILEKIQQANRELQDQEPPDMTRRRRLHFKDTLVDLVVPPMQIPKDGGPSAQEEGEEGSEETNQAENELSEKLSELKVSPREESKESGGGSGRAEESSKGGQELKEGKVLVEKDGKFDLVSINEVESNGFLPPLANNYNNLNSSPRTKVHTVSPSKLYKSSSSPHLHASTSPFLRGIEHLRAPRPPSQPRGRPNSANHSQRASQRRDPKRRVQSATGTPYLATYTLTAQQKELLQKVQMKKEKLAKEAEQRKKDEEEQKRQENEVAFKAWLIRKREQLQEEKRIHRAQEMERMNCKGDPSDPEEAFRLWMQRKQEQQQRDKQLEELKRLEQDTSFLMRSKEECEHAFKLWLKRKRAEKRAEQREARERARRFVLEERRARRMRDLLCTVNEAKPFRFNEQLSYRF
ncbi:coiled-coil domain-containing protein 181 [Genypterus blacodes]|uniref:coiled-coil domain-containing protein 181 n=1 Tax=Genypterus blacodes TaxID=154954 RepID=UPI003F77032C